VSSTGGVIVLKTAAESGKIRVVFEANSDRSDFDALFECTDCDDLLDSVPQKIWVCPTCGYELSRTEAAYVIFAAQDKLEGLLNSFAKRRGFRGWRWVMWLQRMLRLKGA
jgi:ribosomal protein L37AE/L43A